MYLVALHSSGLKETILAIMRKSKDEESANSWLLSVAMSQSPFTMIVVPRSEKVENA